MWVRTGTGSWWLMKIHVRLGWKLSNVLVATGALDGGPGRDTTALRLRYLLQLFPGERVPRNPGRCDGIPLGFSNVVVQ